jgi:Fanconi anemia group M protein
VVLPTGLGKTTVAALVANARLESYETGKVVVLAPTKPLALQHSKAFMELAVVKENQLYTMTGETDPDQRGRMWRLAQFVFATPQTVLNDVKVGRVNFMDVVLLVFDEAHRAVKGYPYAQLASAYMDQAEAPLILALTASPGGTRERVEEVKKNLFIDRVEARTEEDTEVRPYFSPTSLEGIRIPLPDEYSRLLESLSVIYDEKVARLARAGFLHEACPTKTRLLRIRGAIVSRMKASNDTERGRISLVLADQAQAVAISHGIELLETQGIRVLLGYLRRLRERPNPAASVLLDDGRWRKIEREAEKIADIGYPKLEKLAQVVADQLALKKDSKVIVFAQYRETIDTIIERLREEKVNAVRFVGQADKAGGKGMDQKQQTMILERFQRGRFNALVSSSIGEEGLHVPDVDLVVFFEAVPSEIRSIQRKGRTGRTGPGKVVILLAEGTVDEAHYRSSLIREMSMRSLVSH